MQLEAIWEQAWEESLAEQDLHAQFPQEKWRRGGRKTKDKPNGEDLDFWHEAGLEHLKGYVEWIERTGWRIATVGDKPGIELELEATFGGVTVKGIADAVYETPDLLLVDYKTGSRTPSSWVQLCLYAEAMERQYGVRPKYGAFFMTRKNELSALEPLNKYDGSWFDRLFAQLNKARQYGPFLPNLGEACRTCDVVHACYANGGTESHKYDPDDPKFGVTHE